MEKRYDSSSEQTTRQLWDKNNTYSLENNPGPFVSIDTPPPTVSGALHIGHVASYTQGDVVARYQRLNGSCVYYPFGLDDNGLATERLVEKSKNTSASKIGRTAFIKECLAASDQARTSFKSLWQRLGLSINWEYMYSTISPHAQKISQESFIRLYEKGQVYRKEEPALYCTTCRTAIAQADLDSHEEPSVFYDLMFQGARGESLAISTTRPEMLASCVAIVFHPDDERYHQLAGTQATVPLFGHKVPVIADDSVEKDKGTGLVMCCTFGDTADVEWYKKHNLPLRQSIDNNGRWTDITGPAAGLKVTQARQAIVQALTHSNLISNQKRITHVVHVHERCKKPVEFSVLPQWFVKIVEHKQAFLDRADDISWEPAFFKARYRDWVKNLHWDWCISRQRVHGIPFPVWHCLNCKQVLLADFKELPIDPQDTAYPRKSCPECHSSNIVGDTDVMDTWNTSSLTPYMCSSLYNDTTDVLAQKPDLLPMTFRFQAHDIIRTWAFYTIVKSWMHHDTTPWKRIVISGHVLSPQSEKISKSTGNNPLDPENMLARYPADVIRYWASSVSLGHDVAFSEQQLTIGQRLLTKIWNAFRFVQEHIVEIDTNNAPTSLEQYHRWILQRLNETYADYQKALDVSELGKALSCLEDFFWKEWCDMFLELVKDQLFNPEGYDHTTIAATRWTLYFGGLRLLQMFAPYLPYITEAIYQELYTTDTRAHSIHQLRFTLLRAPHTDAQDVRKLKPVLQVVQAVRKLKTEHQLSLKKELNVLTVLSNNQEVLALVKQQEPLLKGATRALTCVYKTGEGSSKLSGNNDRYTATVHLDTV